MHGLLAFVLGVVYNHTSTVLWISPDHIQSKYGPTVKNTSYIYKMPHSSSCPTTERLPALPCVVRGAELARSRLSVSTCGRTTSGPSDHDGWIPNSDWAVPGRSSWPFRRSPCGPIRSAGLHSVKHESARHRKLHPSRKCQAAVAGPRPYTALRSCFLKDLARGWQMSRGWPGELRFAFKVLVSDKQRWMWFAKDQTLGGSWRTKRGVKVK